MRHKLMTAAAVVAEQLGEGWPGHGARAVVAPERPGARAEPDAAGNTVMAKD